MNISQSTGSIIVALLVILTLATVGNMVSSRAQAPTPQDGFWFTKKPSLPQATKEWNIIAAENYLDRLTGQGEWVAGEEGIIDGAGNSIEWTQAHADDVDAEIIKITQILADLPR